MMAEKRYLAAKTVADVWICYPWEATFVIVMLLKIITNLRSDIDEHDGLAETKPS